MTRNEEGHILHVLTLPDGSELTSGAGQEQAAICSFRLTESVNDGSELCPGAACAACVEAELFLPGDSALRLTAGQELRCHRLLPDGSRELLGLFTAEKPTRLRAHTYRLTAYDRMTRTDKDLSPWLRSIQDRFPMTLNAFAAAVCAQCGLTLATPDLPGGDHRIQPFYADGLTGRRLLQWVGQAAGRFCRLTPQGEVEFAWYRAVGSGRGLSPDGENAPTLVRLAGETLRAADLTPETPPPPIYRIRGERWYYYADSLSYEDYETAPLDKVVINQSESDVGVVYPADAAGSNALVLTGNLLLTTAGDAALRPVAQRLYQQLGAVRYTPCRVSIHAGSGVRAGMILPVTDTNGITFYTWVMSCTLDGDRATLESTGSPRRDASSAVNSQTLYNLRGKMLEMETSVDGLKVRASELSGDYAQLTLALDGVKSTVEQDRTLAAEAAAAALEAANANTEARLQAYPTLETMRSEISQSAQGITATVEKTYATRDSLGNYTEIGKVRSAFAMDASSVTVESGSIKFTGSTLVIDTTNFKLDEKGNVSITGNLTSVSNDRRVQIDNGSITCSYYGFGKDNKQKWMKSLLIDPKMAAINYKDPQDNTARLYNGGSVAVYDNDHPMIAIEYNSYWDAGGGLYVITPYPRLAFASSAYIGSNKSQSLDFAASNEPEYRMHLGVTDAQWALRPATAYALALGTPTYPWGAAYVRDLYVYDSGNGRPVKARWSYIESIQSTVLCME